MDPVENASRFPQRPQARRRGKRFLIHHSSGRYSLNTGLPPASRPAVDQPVSDSPHRVAASSGYVLWICRPSRLAARLTLPHSLHGSRSKPRCKGRDPAAPIGAVSQGRCSAIFRRSMRNARHLLAAIAILAFLAPLVHSSIVTAHVLLETSHEAHGHAAELEASLHGHAHDCTTPSHSHSSIAPAPAAGLTHTAAPLAAHPVDMLVAAPIVQLPPGDSTVLGPGVRSSPGRLPPSLLSPILRI